VDRRRFLAAAAAAPFALAAAPRALAGGAGGTALGLVTADLEAGVVAVELTSGRIYRRIETPADPRSIETIGQTSALVTHLASGRLTLIDQRLRVHEIAGRLAEPRYAAVSRNNRYAYVTDSGRGEVATIDLHEREVVGRLRVGGRPRHLTIHNGRPERLWVVLDNKATEIAVVSIDAPRRLTVVGRVRPPFLAHDVGYEPGGARVWVTSGDGRQLAIYDDHGLRLLRTLRADAAPQHVTFLGGRAFVASGDDGLLRMHSLRDGRVLHSTAVPFGSYNVEEGWGIVLNPSLSQGTLTVLSRTGAIRFRRRVARSSHDSCFVMVA
jgi:DNA-binding beta-propeller fold protein YncE